MWLGNFAFLLATMDVDAEFDGVLAAGQEDAQDAAVDGKTPQKKRGRPKGSKSAAKADGKEEGTPDSKQGSAKAKAKSGPAAGVPKSKSQCMCCGRVFDRSAMSNGRYCPDGKKITDRLYHAARSQGPVQTQWLADQLSTLASWLFLCQ